MPDDLSTSKANILLGTALAALSALSLVALLVAGTSSVGVPAFLGESGRFLVGTFSWASIFVPVWLAAAGVEIGRAHV